MSDRDDAPMPEPARRVEIFTGAGRRRVWRAEEKAVILAECNREGETVSGVARRHGLTASQLFWWRRAAREATKRGLEQHRNNQFAAVVVEPDVLRRGRTGENSNWVIEIALGTAIVRAREGIDAATLATALSAIGRMASAEASGDR